MDRNHQILCNVLFLALVTVTGYGQEKSKTYKETFNVGDETVLNIDTSHADIEFETWNKNEVEITAIVELEGASDEEAASYFEKDVVKIRGNSKEIDISTGRSSFSVIGPHSYSFSTDFDIDVPEITFVEPLFEELHIPEIPEVFVIPEMPPMPPIPFTQFDYDAYKKDGEAYLKKWKEEFDKEYNEEYKNRFTEWSKQLEEVAKKREKQQKERQEQRKKLLEQRDKQKEEARGTRDKVRAERDEVRKERDRIREKHESRRVFSIHSGDDSNIFYFSSDGEKRKYKVKKRIKIKMPKSVKLKMNVRHGEVKLAANTKNINASLSYASLLASTIDGDGTDIRASYSPVVVQKWNYGQLKTDYSDEVSLKEVGELRLNSVSSNVVIERLMDKAFLTNNLGELHINSVSDGFSNIDITVENGEVDCKIPATPFSIYVKETTSNFTYPEVLAIGSSRNYNTNVHKGYYITDKEGKSINITSKYSEVVLKD